MEVNRKEFESEHPTNEEVPTQNVVYETTYDYGEAKDGLTVVIIDAIADALDVSPTEIVPRISESVDADALERVLRPLPDGTQREGHLTFFLMDFRITVFGDGTVRIVESSN